MGKLKPTGNFYTVQKLIDDLILIENKNERVLFATGKDSAGKEFSRPIYKTVQAMDETVLYLYLGADCE